MGVRGSMFLEHAFALLGGSEWLRSIAGDMSKNEYEGARRRWQVKSMVAVFVLRLRECFRTVTEIFAFFMHSVCLAGDVVFLGIGNDRTRKKLFVKMHCPAGS